MTPRTKRQSTHFILNNRSLHLPYVPDCAALDARTAFPADTHAHAGYEICYLLSGETHRTLAGGELLHLRSNSFSIIQPNVRHKGLFQRIDPCELAWIVFTPEAATKPGESSLLNKRLLADMAKTFKRAGNTVKEGNARLRMVAQILVDTMRSLPPGDIAADNLAWLQTSLTQVILSVHSLLSDQLPPMSDSSAEIVNRCDIFILKHMAEPIGVADLVRHINMRASTFFSLFKRQTGMTPADYLRRMRIQKAQELMLRTDKSITEIALACGFSSSQYFASSFREYSGVQPRSFRKNFRNNAVS